MALVQNLTELWLAKTAALDSLQTKRSCMVSTMVTSVGKLSLTKFCMRKMMTKSEPFINSIFDPTYSKVQCMSVSIFANCQSKQISKPLQQIRWLLQRVNLTHASTSKFHAAPECESEITNIQNVAYFVHISLTPNPAETANIPTQSFTPLSLGAMKSDMQIK